jgi:hypothetical protein
VPSGRDLAVKQEQQAPPDRLRQVQLLASIVGLVVGVTTLLVGIRNFNHNAEAQFQLSALNTIQHYFDLAIAHPELATREDNQPVDARYAWFASQALTTAQTLRTLVGYQESWQRAIRSIVRQHRSFLRSGAFVCEDFTPDFVDYLRQQVADLRCARG